jgi:hypothetical protein
MRISLTNGTVKIKKQLNAVGRPKNQRRRTMKKLFGKIIIFALAVSFLIGCGNFFEGGERRNAMLREVSKDKDCEKILGETGCREAVCEGNFIFTILKKDGTIGVAVFNREYKRIQ